MKDDEPKELNRDVNFIIDRAIEYIRKKKKASGEEACSLEELISRLGEKERQNRLWYSSAAFIRDLSDAIKLNQYSKLNFDNNQKVFSIRHRFGSAAELVEKLHSEKIGVEENQDLYDDISKEEIAKLKSGPLLRVVELGKGAKGGDTFLFSGFYHDGINDANFESLTTNFLKEKWAEIEKDASDLEKARGANVKYLNKHQPVGAKGPGADKRRQNLDREDNFASWKNSHLFEEIAKANLKLKEKEAQHARVKKIKVK